MLIRSVVPRPSRTSSTLPACLGHEAAGVVERSRIEDRPQARPSRRDAGVVGQRLGQQRRVGRHQPRRRLQVGERTDDAERLLEAIEAGEQAVPVLARFQCDRGPGDDPGRAVVVQVELGVVAGDVDELGVGRGVDDVEGPHEPAAAVHHAVADRARPARAAGQEPADGRAGRRRVHQDLLAGGIGGAFELDERGPGVGGELAVGDHVDRAGAGGVEDEAAAHRDRLAVVAGALAARRDRHPVAHGRGHGGGDRRGVGRRGHQLGPPERQLLADHRRQPRPVSGRAVEIAVVDRHRLRPEQGDELSGEGGDRSGHAAPV